MDIYDVIVIGGGPGGYVAAARAIPTLSESLKEAAQALCNHAIHI